MADTDDERPSLKALRPLARKPLNLSREGIVKTTFLAPDQPLPLVIEPVGESLELVAWLAGNRDLVLEKLSLYGGVLLRGFRCGGVEDFERGVRTISPEMLEYTFRSTPRTEISGRVYSSTEYPADQTIPQHNEMSYTRTWPLKIWFHCIKNAARGGETPIADSRKVFERISPAIREAFASRGVAYVRNYGGDVDLPWQEVFQTRDRSVVEEYCREAGIDFEWKSGGSLSTRQVAQGIARHPATGEAVWFNQAHLFHFSSLDPAVQEFLLNEYGEAGLPRNSYYGDGAAIEPEVLEEIREAYRQESVVFPWQEGDVLLLDNMKVAHGRRPYEGARKVVVGMAESMSSEPVAG